MIIPKVGAWIVLYVEYGESEPGKVTRVDLGKKEVITNPQQVEEFERELKRE